MHVAKLQSEIAIYARNIAAYKRLRGWQHTVASSTEYRQTAATL